MQDHTIIQRNDNQNNIKTTNAIRSILSSAPGQTNVKVQVRRNLHIWIVKDPT